MADEGVMEAVYSVDEPEFAREPQPAKPPLAVVPVSQPAAAIVRHPARPTGLAPQGFADVQMMAKWAAASQLSGAKTPEQAAVVIIRASEMGIAPMSALMRWHWINNKPCMPADDFVGVALAHKEVCVYFRLIASESNAKQAVWETFRVGDPAPVRGTFTMEDAERAGLTKNAMWQKFPQQMLKKRAAAFLARDVYPDLFAGVYSEDEMREVDADRSPRADVAVLKSRALDIAPDAKLLAAFESATSQAAIDACIAAVQAAQIPRGDRRDKLTVALNDARMRVAKAGAK